MLRVLRAGGALDLGTIPVSLEADAPRVKDRTHGPTGKPQLFVVASRRTHAPPHEVTPRSRRELSNCSRSGGSCRWCSTCRARSQWWNGFCSSRRRVYKDRHPKPPHWVDQVAEVREPAPTPNADGVRVTLKRAAVLVLLSDGPEGPSALVSERAADLSTYAGQWVFPGAGVDADDTDLAMTRSVLTQIARQLPSTAANAQSETFPAPVVDLVALADPG